VVKTLVRGRVWKFGNNVNTDVITPGKYENLPIDKMVEHCMEPIDPGFAGNVKEDDVIIAGENFGCGSAREISPRALKHLKISAVIAKSFARTFFRNAIAIGLPVIISKAAFDSCQAGNTVELDIKNSKMTNSSTKAEILIEPIDGFLYSILEKNGIFSAMKEV